MDTVLPVSYLVVSILTADVTLYSWTIFKFVLGYVFWYIMLVKLVTDLKRIRSVIALLVWVHIVLLVLNPDTVLHPETRSYLQAAPFLGDGNDFSLSVCVIFPLCMWLLLSAENKRHKLVYSLVLGCTYSGGYRNTISRSVTRPRRRVRVSLVERQPKNAGHSRDRNRRHWRSQFCPT